MFNATKKQLLCAIVLWLIVLVCTPVLADPGGSNLILVVQNGGTTIGTFTKYMVLNFTSGCSAAGSTITCTSGGVSNSAGANVVTKSNGTNLVASTITDDGTNVTMGPNTVGGWGLKQGACPSGTAGYTLFCPGAGSAVPQYRDGVGSVLDLVDVSAIQSLTNKKLGSLTTNGWVKVISGDGTLTTVVGITDASATTQTNPTAEANLKSTTLTTTLMNTTNNAVRIVRSGTYTTVATTPTIRLRGYLCAVSGCASGTKLTLFDFTTPATTSGATTIAWACDITIATRTTGVSGVVVPGGDCSFNLGTSNTTVTATHNPVIPGAASSAIDLTASTFFQTTALMSVSNAGNNVVENLSQMYPVQ